MRFWDASAIIPLCIDEESTSSLRTIAGQDERIVVWWGSVIEIRSAVARLRRGGDLTVRAEKETLAILTALTGVWTEIMPCDEIREIAGRLLRLHPLRASDSLQLAAALLWANRTPKGHHFVCLDRRLRDAAALEGFLILPD